MRRKALLVLTLALCAGAASAQMLRDPTLAPAAAMAAGEGAAVAKPGGLAVETGQVAVLVRDGTPHLIWGSRLYVTGQRVGTARIERITESEIWLREAGKVSKIKVFQGVEQRIASPAQKP